MSRRAAATVGSTVMERPRASSRLRAALALSVILGAGPSSVRAAPATDLEAEEPASAPVVRDGLTLLRVRGISSLPAQERARRIADRIAAVGDDPAFDPASLRVAEISVGSEILAGTRRLMVVTDADAAVEHAPRPAIAAHYRDSIAEAIGRFRADRTPGALGRAWLATLLIAAALAAFLVLLVVLGRRFDAVLEARLHRRIRHVQIESFQLVDAELIWNAVRGVLRTLRALLALVVAFVALGLALKRFPGTRTTANELLSYVVDPLRAMGRSAAGALPNLIFLAVLALIVRWVLKAMRLFFESVKSGAVTLRGFDPTWGAPTYRLARVAVLAFPPIVAYPYIPGSSNDAFKAVSIFAGILFHLGSSSVIASVIAGYAMTYRKTFRLGDRVKIGGVVGDVVQMGVMVTRLRTIKNEEAVVPNSQILQGEV